MAGIHNEILYGQDVDFRGVWPPVGQMQTVGNGALLIGSASAPFARAALPTINANGNLAFGAGAIAFNPYNCAKWIVDPTANIGTHTTIQAAINAASSGDTVFIRANATPYTENLTLKTGVNLAAFSSDASQNNTGNVKIIGKATFTGAGTVNIGGLELQTNSDFLLEVSGSSASNVNLINCYLNMSNNTGISYTSSSSSSGIILFNCRGNIGTTGISPFAHSGAGQIIYEYCNIGNSALSSTASTISAGALTLKYTRMNNPITSSGTASETIDYSILDSNGQNLTMYTCGGSGSTHRLLKSWIGSGTASAISTSQTLECHDCLITSTNANAITGSGTLNFSGLNFTSGISNAMNVSTMNGRNTMLGSVSFDKGLNYLDTYAVGTFLPTLVGATTPGTHGYANRSGYYTKIGNLVHVQIQVAIAGTNGTGDINVGNLPFTIKNQTDGAVQGPMYISSTLSWPASRTTGVFNGNPNTTLFNVPCIGSGQSASNMQIANTVIFALTTTSYQV